MYVFGGFQSGYKTNDLTSYSVHDDKWHCLDKGDHSGPPKYVREIPEALESGEKLPIIKREIPLPKSDGKLRPDKRIGARMVYNNNNRCLYLQGGIDLQNEPLNDMWCFSLDSGLWSEVEQNGPRPAPRSGHSLTFCDDKIILFGGLLEVTKETEDLYQFDIQSNFWKIHKRTNHERCTNDDNVIMTQNSFMDSKRDMSPMLSQPT